MNTKDTLQKLLHSNAIAPVVMDRGQHSVTLVEETYNFTLRHIPNDSIVIKCDKFPNLCALGQEFFLNENGECKRADYALISESSNVIMFFELKKSKRSSKRADAILQLKGATCVVNYCGLIAAEFLNKPRIFDGFLYRYYIVHHDSLRKRSFREDRPIDNSTPHMPRIIGGAFMAFGDL